MVLAFIIPQLNFTTSVVPSLLPASANAQVLNDPLWIHTIDNVTDVQVTNNSAITTAKEKINYKPIAIAVYFLGVLAMLLVFIKKLWIIKKFTANYKVRPKEPIIRLLPYKIMPFSFGKNIYLNERQYLNNEIDASILEHEKAHVVQLHTADIIFTELLHIIFWFNPVMICIKKSVKINHEYLADTVAARSISVKAYQEKIISWSAFPAYLRLTSSFNYLTIKKRLIMLQTPYKLKNVIITMSLSLMVVIFSIITFSKYNIVSAQTSPRTEHSNPAAITIDTPRSIHQSYIAEVSRQLPIGQGITEAEAHQYEQLIQKNLKKNERGHYITNMSHFSTADYEAVKKIYAKMNGVQRSLNIYRLLFLNKLTSINTPTAQQFAGFKNAATYGVWIDDKMVANASLGKYSNTDFADFFISKLYNKAKEGKSYTHQVDLYTKKYVNSSNEAMRPKLDSLSLFVTYPSFIKADNAGSTRFNELNDITIMSEKPGMRKVKLTLKNGTTELFELNTETDNNRLKEKYGIVYRKPAPFHK